MSNSTMMISDLDRELLPEQARHARQFPHGLVDNLDFSTTIKSNAKPK